MDTTIRHQLGQIVSAHQNAVTGTLLFVTAFLVVTLNAIFNQPGNHPLPLWGSDKSVITNSISVPVRRVETTLFKAEKVPVPQLRPLPIAEQQSAVPSFSTQVISQITLVELKNVQDMLSQMDFYSGPIDGLIGSGTKSAIKAFEHSKYLPENGEITNALILLLESAVNARLQTKSERIASNDTPDLLPAENGEMITRIQVGLINYGIPGISIDGVMGNQTRDAIKQFQKKFKLQITGVPTPELVNKLESVGALTKG